MVSNLPEQIVAYATVLQRNARAKMPPRCFQDCYLKCFCLGLQAGPKFKFVWQAFQSDGGVGGRHRLHINRATYVYVYMMWTWVCMCECSQGCSMLMSRCPSHSFREGSPALVGSGRKQAGRTAIATVLALLISLANPYDTCENRWEAQNGMSKEFAKISN